MTSRQVSCILVVLGLAPALAACNTVAGIGQDLQAAGRAITGSSERAQQGTTGAAQTPAPRGARGRGAGPGAPPPPPPPPRPPPAGGGGGAPLGRRPGSSGTAGPR